MSYPEGIRIDYDTADKITRLTLIESLKGINKDIARLEDRNQYKDFEKIEDAVIAAVDLKNNLKYREALLVVIEYFSTEEQMKEMTTVL